MYQWEYMTATVAVVKFMGIGGWQASNVSAPGIKGGKLDAFLSEAGSQGWELVGANFSYHPMMLIFKRPVSTR